MRFGFRFGFLVTDVGGGSLPEERLESAADRLMGAKTVAENGVVFDPAVGATLTAGEVEVEVEVSATDEGVAAIAARNFVVDAIRSIGGEPAGVFTFAARSAPMAAAERWHEQPFEVDR